jgi:hypothetical protein
MKILFLTNNARGSYRFFLSLAERFRENGHAVHFASDSRYSIYINHLSTQSFQLHSFHTFLKKYKYKSDILAKYSNFNLNNALFSDFDRAAAYKQVPAYSNSDYDYLKSALLCFFESIVSEHKINAVIYESVTDTFAYYAWFVCQLMGVSYCGLTASRIPGRFTITDDPLAESNDVYNKFIDIIEGKLDIPQSIREFSAKYLDSIDLQIPDYMRSNGLDIVKLLSRSPIRDTIRTWIGALRFCHATSFESFETGNPLQRRLGIARRVIERKCKVPRLKSFYELPNTNDNYILYPLHYHPEASTSVLSPTYISEYEVIRNIAFNLPEGLRLYVKDHLSAHGYPSLKFYSLVRKLPNTTLIGPRENTKALIRRAIAIITLSSTVGYEALIIGKPIFLFGRTFYEFHNNVTRVNDPSKLFYTLKETLKSPPTVTREYNLSFIAAYYMCSFDGTLNITSARDDGTVDKVYNALQRFLTYHGVTNI